MNDSQDVRLGEVYRLCLEIRADVKTQNGRVTAVERDVSVLKDRGDQSRDGHARYAGWSGVLLSAASMLWQSFHKP